MSPALLALVLSAASVQLDAPGVSPELVDAVRSELATAGFSGEGEPLVARIGLVAAEGGIDCTVEDRVTHKTVTRRLAYDPAAPRANRRLAVQAVELLHASLAEARFAPPPAPVPPAVDTFLEQREPPPSPPRWRFEASGGAAVMITGAVPWIAVSGRARVGNYELGARVGSVLQTWTLAGTLGHADIGAADARAVASWPISFSFVTLRPELSIGLLFAWANGHTDQHGFVGTTTTAESAAPGVALNVDLILSSWLALTLRVGSVLAVPAIAVKFDTTAVGFVGTPMLDLSLGLTIR